jgi:hypothetical protein
MQPIQDKDFDKVFKDAFESAEIVPSRNLWPEIELQINEKKIKKFPFLWLAAAMVLIVASVSILRYNKQAVVPIETNTVAKNSIENVTPVVKTEEKPTVAVVNNTIETQKIALVKQVNGSNLNANKIEVLPAKQHSPATTVDKSEQHKQEVFIAKADDPQQDLNKKIEEVINHPIEETVLASTNTVKDIEKTGAVQEENKGIRNVGDLVNMVVNKVDKRKDKFIQFKTDDDDSSLASINIGPFRFGKRK